MERGLLRIRSISICHFILNLRLADARSRSQSTSRFLSDFTDPKFSTEEDVSRWVTSLGGPVYSGFVDWEGDVDAVDVTPTSLRAILECGSKYVYGTLTWRQFAVKSWSRLSSATGNKASRLCLTMLASIFPQDKCFLEDENPKLHYLLTDLYFRHMAERCEGKCDWIYARICLQTEGVSQIQW